MKLPFPKFHSGGVVPREHLGRPTPDNSGGWVQVPMSEILRQYDRGNLRNVHFHSLESAERMLKGVPEDHPIRPELEALIRKMKAERLEGPG